jgi:1-deoxy-D-xylulose-5-phosphate synthase
MDEASLKASLEFMANYDEGLSAVRYPRDAVSPMYADQPCPPFEIGKARALLTHPAPDVAILAYGTMAIDASEAARSLSSEYAVEVYDARFAKPVDVDLLRSLLGRGIPVITIEDHSIEGGFGTCVLDACNQAGLDARLVTRMALPDRWIYQGERKDQLVEVGLDPLSIARRVRDVVEAHGGARSGGSSVTPVARSASMAAR